ncbi:MAG TPA: folylpolyglutamate synthase/dihydrofolate synthase family protein [bacterium]|jgi:dihydrofolate synthase/folylpolyglutamate synthase
MNRRLTWNDFYGLQRFGMTPNLDNIRLFCERLGNPEQAFPCVHISGTNGKGSVTAMLDAVLRNCRLKVGMYTSPHLIQFEERIRVDGRLIPEDAVFDFLEKHWKFISEHSCTFFEVATAMGLDYFRRSGVDLAVAEVGLGGTYDATRVVQSILSVITRIDLDHTERLGETREEIARDKAGIFRRGFPALSGDQQPEVVNVLRSRAEELGAVFHMADDLVGLTRPRISRNHISATVSFRQLDLPLNLGRITCPLTGSFQFENLKLVLAALSLLAMQLGQITSQTIRNGLASVSWPGRLQELRRQPHFILDVAHNPGAVLASLHNTQNIWKPDRIIAIFGALRDKDIAGMIAHLKQFCPVGFMVPLPPPRGLGFEEIQSIPARYGWNAKAVQSVNQAVEEGLAFARKRDLILAIGSHYLAEEVLKNPEFH